MINDGAEPSSAMSSTMTGTFAIYISNSVAQKRARAYKKTYRQQDDSQAFEGHVCSEASNEGIRRKRQVRKTQGYHSKWSWRMGGKELGFPIAISMYQLPVSLTMRKTLLKVGPWRQDPANKRYPFVCFYLYPYSQMREETEKPTSARLDGSSYAS